MMTGTRWRVVGRPASGAVGAGFPAGRGLGLGGMLEQAVRGGCSWLRNGVAVGVLLLAVGWERCCWLRVGGAAAGCVMGALWEGV